MGKVQKSKFAAPEARQPGRDRGEGEARSPEVPESTTSHGVGPMGLYISLVDPPPGGRDLPSAGGSQEILCEEVEDGEPGPAEPSGPGKVNEESAEGSRSVGNSVSRVETETCKRNKVVLGRSRPRGMDRRVLPPGVSVVGKR